jgi:membrane associated rhomboid family serine protease
MFFIPYGTREATPRQSFPIMTVLLVIVNVIVFAFEAYLVATRGDSGLNSFLERYATVPAAVTGMGLLQIGLLTSMFLHAGLLHIVGNMMYLLPFGDNVEDRLGHIRYLFFYVLCGLAATLLYVAFNPHSTAPLLGASGAIAGVLGGYLVLHPRGTVKGFFFIIILLLRVDLPAWVFIGYWFVMQLFSSIASFGGGETASTGVAFLAHVGGFVAGVVLAPLLAATRKTPAAPGYAL